MKYKEPKHYTVGILEIGWDCEGSENLLIELEKLGYILAEDLGTLDREGKDGKFFHIITNKPGDRK